MSALEEIVKAVHAVRAKKGGTSFAQWAAFRLESLSGYKLPHGYAIAIGICIDLGYATEKGLLKPKDRDRIVTLLGSCGALDGLTHSGHLLGQEENLLRGLDAWALSSGDPALAIPRGIGKGGEEPAPDRGVYGAVLKNLGSAPTAG